MTRTLATDPRRDGYRMPGEFEPHAGCWMLWPERPDNWRLGGKPAQLAFAAVAAAIAGSEPVTVGVSARQFANARRLLPPAVRVVEISSNDAWMRDVGPTFVVNDRGGIRGVDWMFNAWGGLQGGLYFPWDQDDAVAQKVLEIEGRDRYRAPFVLEGGAIHVDGQGTLITTEECLLNPNRNPAPVARRDRAPAAPLPGRGRHHLARQGRASRRDRRPRGQPVRVHAARRSRIDLDRRQARPAVRDLARCVRAPEGGSRRPRQAARGAQAGAARPARHDDRAKPRASTRPRARNRDRPVHGSPVRT